MSQVVKGLVRSYEGVDRAISSQEWERDWDDNDLRSLEEKEEENLLDIEGGV